MLDSNMVITKGTWSQHHRVSLAADVHRLDDACVLELLKP